MKIKVLYRKINADRKGSSAVFLTMILASVFLLVGLFISQSMDTAGRSYSDAVLELAGRSVLSEYDKRLLIDYGLFAVHADEKEIEQKIRWYAESSLSPEAGRDSYAKKRLIPLKLKLETVHASVSGYSMTNIELFEKQVESYMKYGLANKILTQEKQKEDEDTMSDNDLEGGHAIILKNQQIRNSLPSYGYTSANIDIKKLFQAGIPSPQEIKDQGKERFLLNEYIIATFLNQQKKTEERTTFFLNETEYILAGSFNDESNYKKVRTDLVLMRSVLNLPCIYSDPVKRRAVEALASILTPGPEQILTQLLIAAGWSAAEAENDLKRIEKGEKVALFKTKDQWALNLDLNLDLKGFMNGKTQNGVIEPKNKAGIDYQDYLRILLYLQNHEIQMLRCMDLIQLNMKATYYGDFDLKEYYGGFQVDAVIGGRTYSYIQKY